MADDAHVGGSDGDEDGHGGQYEHDRVVRGVAQAFRLRSPSTTLLNLGHGFLLGPGLLLLEEQPFPPVLLDGGLETSDVGPETLQEQPPVPKLQMEVVYEMRRVL